MSSAAAASWTTRYAARWARGQCRWKSASIPEADPRWAARTKARSSRPAPIHRLYGRGRRTGPSCDEDEAGVVRRAGDPSPLDRDAARAEGAERSLRERRGQDQPEALLDIVRP